MSRVSYSSNNILPIVLCYWVVFLGCVKIQGIPGAPGKGTGTLEIFDGDEIDPAEEGTIVAIRGKLDPSIVLELSDVAGLVLREGGMTSHGVTIAREFGIPCVCALEGSFEKLPAGVKARVDGSNGIVEFEEQT